MTALRFAAIGFLIVFPIVFSTTTPKRKRPPPVPIKWCYNDDDNVRCFQIGLMTLQKMETARQYCKDLKQPEDELAWNLPKVDTKESMQWVRNLTLIRDHLAKKIVFWLGLERIDDGVKWRWLLSAKHENPNKTYKSLLNNPPWVDWKWKTDPDKKCVLAVLDVLNPNPSIEWYAVSCATQRSTMPDVLKKKEYSQLLVCEEETFGAAPDDHSGDRANGDNSKKDNDDARVKTILYALIGVVAFMLVCLIVVTIVCVVRTWRLSKNSNSSSCTSTSSNTSSTRTNASTSTSRSEKDSCRGSEKRKKKTVIGKRK